jgi:SnoaL-like domain
MELWELVARESIRDLVARYNANGDSGRIDQMLALFAPDALLEVGGVWHRGRAGIESVFRGALERLAKLPSLGHLRHSTTTLQIDLVDRTHASSRCYFFVMMEHGLDHWGRYLDEFGVVDGSWLFTKRRVLIDKETRPL